MERVILHCDMNNFFASVECAKNPALKGHPVAVCGSQEARHGIVLAKNYEAKAYGIETGEPVVKAKAKCRDLIAVPPHYDDYLRYSAAARAIYESYTDLVEPMGCDECYLDVTGSRALFGDGETIAHTLRERIKRELGVTISVGVSFNKTFAKLGSDMKKPDAVTCLSPANFREKVFPLPVSDLCGVGHATTRTLAGYGIHTVGQLAAAYPPMLQHRLGVVGLRLIEMANGRDPSPVLPADAELPMKSVSHGITTYRDMMSPEEVWPVILALCEEIGHKLLAYGKTARGVSLQVRDNTLQTRQYQARLSLPTDSYSVIAKEVYRLLREKHVWERPLRSVSAGAIDLCRDGTPCQIGLFDDASAQRRAETLDHLADALNQRYGEGTLRYGAVLGNRLAEVGGGFGFSAVTSGLDPVLRTAKAAIHGKKGERCGCR